MSAMPPPLPPPLPPRPSPSRMGDDAGMRMLLPVGRSGLAIAAGYLGLISILVVPAPLAVWLGIWAIRDIQRSQGTDNPKHGMGRAIFGIVMGAIVLGLLAVVLCSWMVRGGR
ncbi:MAG: DUF4190 domain-containing protein [Planctomycetota bacterium]|nr:DUF4190 domain-containing protein [Planctomycetota bacterium]